MESFRSADNFDKFYDPEDPILGVKAYIREHPLTEVLLNQKWNNIPIPVRELAEMLCQAMIGQDLHTWERKCLNNKRFSRIQN